MWCKRRLQVAQADRVLRIRDVDADREGTRRSTYSRGEYNADEDEPEMWPNDRRASDQL